MSDWRSMKWTDEETALLRTLWADGLTAGQCALRIDGKSRNAIIGRVHRLRLEMRGQSSGKTRRADKPRTGKNNNPRGWNGRTRSPLRNAAAKYTHTPKPPKIRLEPPMPPSCQPVTLMARTSHQCGWIIGETAGPLTLMCGSPKPYAEPYCAHHTLIARSVETRRKWTPERRAMQADEGRAA